MSKIDYENERKKQMQSTSGRKLLLHSCCAPCSSGVIERLVDDFDITIYFYNPNMDCEEEYLKRASEQARYIKEAFSDKVKLVIPPYSKQEFLTGVAGLFLIQDSPTLKTLEKSKFSDIFYGFNIQKKS